MLDLIAGRPYFNLRRDARLYFRNFPYDYPFEKLKADPGLAIYPTPEANLAKAPKGFALKIVGVTRQMLAAEKTLERAAGETEEKLRHESFPRIARFGEELREKDLAPLTDRELVELFRAGRAGGIRRVRLPGPEGGRAGGAGDPEAAGGASGCAGGGRSPGRRGPAPRRGRSRGGVRPGRRAPAPGGGGAGAGGVPAPLRAPGSRGDGAEESRWRELPWIANCKLRTSSCKSNKVPCDEVVTGRKVNARQAGVYLERARRYTALRETSKHFLMLGYEGLRRLLLELDRRHGLGGGIFYLEPGELDALAAGEDPRARIAARGKRRALALGLEAPRVLFGDDLDAIGRPVSLPAAGDSLAGTGVSPGAAEGRGARPALSRGCSAGRAGLHPGLPLHGPRLDPAVRPRARRRPGDGRHPVPRRDRGPRAGPARGSERRRRLQPVSARARGCGWMARRGKCGCLRRA